MAAPAAPRPRHAAVDGLRALALLAVVSVNWVGYEATRFGGPLYPPTPGGSAWAQAAMALVLALLAGKGITLLSMLVGYGQVLSSRARGEAAQARRAQRLRRMGALGLLHGFFIYAGDVLSTYAVTGWVVRGRTHWRLRRLRASLWRWAGVVIGVHLFLAVIVVVGVEADATAEASWVAAAGYAAWWRLNAADYLILLFSAVWMLPTFVLLFTFGIYAARLRLLTHPRWRPLWRRLRARWLWPGLLLNTAVALLTLRGWAQGQPAVPMAVMTSLMIVAIPLLLGAVPALLLGAQRLLVALAPAGRHTLSLYIGSSVISLGVFSGAGLGWFPGTVGVAAMALGYWLLWMTALGPALQRAGWRLPLERWLGGGR